MITKLDIKSAFKQPNVEKDVILQNHNDEWHAQYLNNHMEFCTYWERYYNLYSTRDSLGYATYPDIMQRHIEHDYAHIHPDMIMWLHDLVKHLEIQPIITSIEDDGILSDIAFSWYSSIPNTDIFIKRVYVSFPTARVVKYGKAFDDIRIIIINYNPIQSSNTIRDIALYKNRYSPNGYWSMRITKSGIYKMSIFINEVIKTQFFHEKYVNEYIHVPPLHVYEGSECYKN